MTVSFRPKRLPRQEDDGRAPQADRDYAITRTAWFDRISGQFAVAQSGAVSEYYLDARSFFDGFLNLEGETLPAGIFALPDHEYRVGVRVSIKIERFVRPLAILSLLFPASYYESDWIESPPFVPSSGKR
jgi:hypothetical protein